MTDSEQVRTLRKEIRQMQLVAERKNIELSALRMVWCSGGCDCMSEEITPEMVAFVERYATRLRTWYINHAGRGLTLSGSWTMESLKAIWQESADEIDKYKGGK